MGSTLFSDDAGVFTLVLRGKPVVVASASSVDKLATLVQIGVVVPLQEESLARTRQWVQTTVFTYKTTKT